MATFNETDDSVDESIDNIVESTWDQLSADQRRLRKVMLQDALRLWIEEGYVVVPDDYMGED